MLSLLFNHKKYPISEHDRNIPIGLRITDVCDKRLGITLFCLWLQRFPLLLLLCLKSLLKLCPKNVSELATSPRGSTRLDTFLHVFIIILYFLIWYLGIPQSISVIGTSYQYNFYFRYEYGKKLVLLQDVKFRRFLILFLKNLEPRLYLEKENI